MLVIQLKPGEHVAIGDNIKVFNTGDFAAKIGIDAPRDIPIARQSAKDKSPRDRS